MAPHDYNDSCCEKHTAEKTNDKQQLQSQYVRSWGKKLLQMHAKINASKALLLALTDMAFLGYSACQGSKINTTGQE